MWLVRQREHCPRDAEVQRWCKVGAEVQICKGVGAEVRGSAEVFVQVICSRYEEEMKTCIVGAE